MVTITLMGQLQTDQQVVNGPVFFAMRSAKCFEQLRKSRFIVRRRQRLMGIRATIGLYGGVALAWRGGPAGRRGRRPAGRDDDAPEPQGMPARRSLVVLAANGRDRVRSVSARSGRITPTRPRGGRSTRSPPHRS